MASKIGINGNIEQRIISGTRVAFDPRTTGEANNTRDPKNRKSAEKPMREAAWRDRQRQQNKEAA